MTTAEKELILCLYAFIREQNIPEVPTDKYTLIFNRLVLDYSMDSKTTFPETQSPPSYYVKDNCFVYWRWRKYLNKQP